MVRYMYTSRYWNVKKPMVSADIGHIIYYKYCALVILTTYLYWQKKAFVIRFEDSCLFVNKITLAFKLSTAQKNQWITWKLAAKNETIENKNVSISSKTCTSSLVLKLYWVGISGASYQAPTHHFEVNSMRHWSLPKTFWALKLEDMLPLYIENKKITTAKGESTNG